MVENAEDVRGELGLFGIEKGTEIERLRKVAEANTFFDVPYRLSLCRYYERGNRRKGSPWLDRRSVE